MTLSAPDDHSPVVAAGVVLWRRDGGTVRVLLVRRDTHGDWSLPKGKVDPGETIPEAAVRETLEETGYGVWLGVPLGVSEYAMPSGRDKVVHYWAARVDSSREPLPFIPNEEIAEIAWAELSPARQRLTYDRDREVLDRFGALVENDALRTFAVIALRHGKAVPATSWTGPDSTRPLEQVGLEQARASARAIALFRPKKLISSTAARCISTIEPVATLTGLDVKATAAISQDAWEERTATVRNVIAKRLEKRDTTVLCSHGPVLPEILDELSAHTTDPRMLAAVHRAANLDVGSFSVVHFSRADPTGPVLAVETHSSGIR